MANDYIRIERWDDKEAWFISFYFGNKIMNDTYGYPPVFLVDSAEEIEEATQAFKQIRADKREGFYPVWTGSGVTWKEVAHG